MENAIFDEAKGVYRVNHRDGSFDTYTPAQYREKFSAEPIVEEEEEDADIIIDATEVVEDEVIEEVIDATPTMTDADVITVTEEDEEEITSEPTQE